MTIHDELILELIKPDKWGKPTGDIIKIVGTSKIEYRLEESVVSRYKTIATSKEVRQVVWKESEMAPDILVKDLNSKKVTAVELENDIQWDFGQSLRQVKKYKRAMKWDVVVIIPKEYERFAILYKNEGFRVWLWKATRLWQCLRCGTITEEERTVKPKCPNKECKSNEQRLKGLKDVTFEEYSSLKWE